MKKIFSLAMVLCLAAGSFAQVKVDQNMAKEFKATSRHQVAQMSSFKDAKHVAREAVYQSNKIEMRSAAQAKKAAQAVAAATADTALWIASYNCFRGGYFTDGWESNPMIMHQWDDSVMFFNASVMTGDQFGWFINGTELSSDTNLVVNGAEIFESNDQSLALLPELAFENGASYFMGDAWQNYYKTEYPAYAESFEVYWATLPESYKMPLTFCDLYSSADMTGSSTGWNLDYWLWNPDTKSYMWGSNFDASAQLSQYGLTKRCDTICTSFGMKGIELSIDTITLAFYAIGTTLPAGSGVKMDIYPVNINAQGYAIIDWNNKITSCTATAADTAGTYVYTPAQTGLTENVTMGVLNFPVKANIRGQFAVELSGFNNNNANIGFLADDISIGSTYHVINGQYLGLWYTNLAMSFNASCTNATALPAIKADGAAVAKSIKNGQLVISKDGRFFNALGAEIK